MRTPPRHVQQPRKGPRHARSRSKGGGGRSRKLVIVGLIIALPAVLSLTAKAFAPTPAASTDAEGGVGAMLGAYVRSTPSNSRADQQSSFDAFQQNSGRELAIDHFYLPWGSTAGSLQWRATWDLNSGRVPLITFGAGGDTKAVANGDHDAYLASLAGAVRSLEGPVFLRYAPDMDVAADASWVHSGPDYVAAWQHVRQVFSGAKAAWVWSPTANAFAGGRGGVEQYWPGEDSVDWIAADGYNRYACQGAASKGSWRELSDVFRSFYAWGSTKGKPLMIAGTGTTEDPADGARKGDWFQNAARTLQTSMPNVKALVYAQSTSGGCDWRTATSDASQTGFNELAADPWFQLPASTLGVISRPPTSTTKPVPTTTKPAPTTTKPAPTTTNPPPPPGGGGGVNGKLVPGSGALWGSSSVSDSLESALGRRFDISHTYHDWDDKFPDSGELARSSRGTTLFINWTPRFFGTSKIVQWSSIASGSQDAQIRATADRVKAYGRPMFLAFHTEPEPDVGQYGSAASFVAAWRHIHDVFRAQGVSNVVWVWNVTGSSGWYSLYTGGLYPGDAYVDWIGWDPYNWYTCHNQGWISFGDKVMTGYKWFMANGFGDKPFMLSEYGTRDMPGNASAKADWFRGIVPALVKMPNLKALVYFNNGTANPGCDWRINTTSQAQAAFADAGRQSFVNR